MEGKFVIDVFARESPAGEFTARRDATSPSIRHADRSIEAELIFGLVKAEVV